jgi:glycosyltransferase involved in cell wall biosynthesis
MLVSIYLPTHNRVDLLQRAIESVCAQTYKNIELIVVNDASTDGTEEYLRKKAQVESRLVHFYNSKPRGAPASRNLAILRSNGSFVTGLDDDDEFHPDRIGAFVDYWKLLTERGVRPACLYSQETWLRYGVPYLVTQRRGNVSVDDLFEANIIGNQVFAPKAHFVDVGLFDEQLPAWQDLDLFIRILARYGRGHLLDMSTYLFDHSPRTDRISSGSKKIRRAVEIVIEKHAAKSCRKSQQLFLQVFGDHYQIYPSIFDWIRFLRWGIWLGGIYRLLRATIKRETP